MVTAWVTEFGRCTCYHIEHDPSTDKIGEAVVCENVPDIGTSVFWLYDITSTDDNNGVVYTVYQEKTLQSFMR